MTKQKYQLGSEQGAALVIAIFSLMLISVVATTLLLTAGTQTAIRSNYKSAMHAFYDAKAGLEEARGRLWLNNPDSAAVISCVFPNGVAIIPGQACYIINPSGSENVDPRDPANAYADLEFQQEFPTSTPSGAQLILSTSAAGGIAGPLYKWVRITPKTEQSAGFDADGDGHIDATPMFFDGQNVFDGKGAPVPPGTAQVLTVTSLAVTPYGSRRLVQYTVAPASLTAGLPNFPSALTLDGNGVSVTVSGGASINGNDNMTSPPPPGGVPAIGYINSSDVIAPSSSYQSPTGVSSVENLNSTSPPLLSPALQTPAGLEALVATITQTADAVITPPAGTVANQSSLPPMSATNPAVVVVDGDFRLTHSGGTGFTGYGLLLVTGTFYYDPDDSWNGIILVIGKGVFNGSQTGHYGQINGTVFVANTRDSAGNLLNYLGPASFTLTGGGNGIRYSSNYAQTAPLLPYQVLSFREIAQTTP